LVFGGLVEFDSNQCQLVLHPGLLDRHGPWAQKRQTDDNTIKGHILTISLVESMEQNTSIQPDGGYSGSEKQYWSG